MSDIGLHWQTFPRFLALHIAEAKRKNGGGRSGYVSTVADRRRQKKLTRAHFSVFLTGRGWKWKLTPGFTFALGRAAGSILPSLTNEAGVELNSHPPSVKKQKEEEEPSVFRRRLSAQVCGPCQCHTKLMRTLFLFNLYLTSKTH